MDFGKGEFILEVSNEGNSASARIIKVSKGSHTVVAMATIPTGKTKELLRLTKQQQNIIDKVFKPLKDKLDKAEIESVTLGFPQLISIKITKKKKERL
jgi:hypothetical protein